MNENILFFNRKKTLSNHMTNGMALPNKFNSTFNKDNTNNLNCLFKTASDFVKEKNNLKTSNNNIENEINKLKNNIQNHNF